MSSLTERLLSTGSKGIKSVIMTDSEHTSSNYQMAKTRLPVLNIALSGDITGGVGPGLGTVAGPSKHFKSSLSLLIVAAYLKKHDDAVCVFYDNEFGITDDYLSAYGVDPARVIHTPIMNVEDLKFDAVKKLEELKKGDKVIFLLDSMGNLASKKELEDAKEENAVADMSRAKQLKSFYRMITPYLTMKQIPFIQIAHTYSTQEKFSKTIISGGCLVEGTKLEMADGTLKSIEDIVCGDEVRTLMGSKEVTHTWTPETLAEGTPECFEVEFDDGYLVTCSHNHPFLVQRKDGTRVWVKASELTIHDDVVTESTGPASVNRVESVGRKQVYDISVADAEHYVLENGVVTHNTGQEYSSNWQFIVGRQQEKEGTDLVGYNFVINVEKSRYVREKSKLIFAANFETGIDPYSGLLDIALDMGFVVKPSNGWFQTCLINEDGEEEISEKKYRRKETSTAEFWGPVLKSDTFRKAIRDRYCLVSADPIDQDTMFNEVDTYL